MHYSGVTDKELPFAISHSYNLNGETVDPSSLKNVTGKLEVHLSYANNTSATVNASGSSHSVKEPYAMASLVSFDAEHAKIVKVNNGQVMDQDGSFIAMGMAMPGLAQSLELDDMVDLPESVIITADVVGFDMPDITTMATNQTLGMIDESTTDNLDSNLDDIFSQVSSIQEATEQLSQGMQGVSQALAGISEGLAKIQAGYAQLSEATNEITEASAKLSQGTQAMSKGIGTAIKEMQGNINRKLDSVSALRDHTEEQGAFCGNASNMPASTTFVVTAKADA